MTEEEAIGRIVLNYLSKWGHDKSPDRQEILHHLQCLRNAARLYRPTNTGE